MYTHEYYFSNDQDYVAIPEVNILSRTGSEYMNAEEICKTY